MTYSLPFGLKQKPMNHYFEHGVIKFNIRDGVLGYMVVLINKEKNARLMIGHVKSKAHLDKLLAIKNLNEIPALEEVVS